MIFFSKFSTQVVQGAVVASCTLILSLTVAQSSKAGYEPPPQNPPRDPGRSTGWLEVVDEKNDLETFQLNEVVLARSV